MHPTSTAGRRPLCRPPADIPADLLPLLTLPDATGLAEAQSSGRACAYAGGPLTLASAVDLGEHRTDGGLCFLQSCGPCLASHAMEALARHAAACEPCNDRQRLSECAIGRGLDRTQRSARRMGRGGCR